MSSFSVVSLLTAPALKDVTQPDLIKFDVEFTSYQDKVLDLNLDRDTSRQITSASIRQWQGPLLLQSICRLEKIEGASNATAATNDIVKSSLMPY